MKYIRTKDGRILIAPYLYNNGGMFLASEPPMYETRNAKNECGYVFCHDVIKQTDTIEELCDMFVFRAGECVIIDQDNDKFFRGNWKCYDTIYGAIWTDFGLKYVAKMNEKGELELL